MDSIRVFIAEDESIVREGLRDMIPWAQYGFEFVGDAPDGEMALPLIRRLRPDILITDIKMPFMDGLTLSEIVSRELPDTKIIIISGYGEFEYAQQAIRLNVDQYLLKPVTRASMIQALEQTHKKIREELEQKDYLRKYEQEFRKFERYSRRAFFEKLVEGSMPIQEIYEEADRLHLNLIADEYNFMLFTVQGLQETAYSEKAANILESLLDTFLRYPDYILFRCSLLSYAVLIKSDRGQIEAATARSVDMIQSRCDTGEALSWYVAVGTPSPRLSGLKKCYAEASQILAYRHIFPEQHVLTPELLKTQRGSEPGGLEAPDSVKADPAVFRGFIQNGLTEETEAFAREYIENLGSAVYSVLFRHYLIMTVRVQAELVLGELGCDIAEFRKSIPPAGLNLPADGLENDLVSVLKPVLELRDRNAQRQNNDVVEDALFYIDQNYCDPNISLNSVAQAINISANYLSAMFSQKMGLSFVEYLTQKRMSRARQLLRQSNRRSGEIAYEVGYRDPRYFSFVFKKTQGCTPKSFRSNSRESES